MRLVRHEGHKTTHTHTNQGSCPPWLRPLLMSWTGLIVWHAVIGLWAFLSLRRLLCSRSCRVVRCVHPWDTEHYESFLQRTATERVYGEVEFDTFSSPNCVVWIQCTGTHWFFLGWTPSPPLWNPTFSRKSGTLPSRESLQVVGSFSNNSAIQTSMLLY